MKNWIKIALKWLRAWVAWVVVLAIIGLGAILWALLPDSEPDTPIIPPTTTTVAAPDDLSDTEVNDPMGSFDVLGAGGAEVESRQPSAPAPSCPDIDVSHCGCEGACSKCHHLCLECKCGSHIIDRGIKCQEFAACETGCSSDTVPEGSAGRAEPSGDTAGGVAGPRGDAPSPPHGGGEPGIKPCKHCHKICDDSHGGDANPACQACIAEHCILAAADVGRSGPNVADSGHDSAPVGLGGEPSDGCQQLDFVGSYLLEPDRFTDPSDGPYVEGLLSGAATDFGCS